MKRVVIFAIGIFACMMLFACGNNTKVESDLSEETVSIQVPQTEDEKIINNPIIGKWIAQGTIYEGNVISFDDNDVLADLYDTEWIYINDDYSFSKQSGPFTGKGVWEQVEIEGAEYAYRFEQESSSRLSIDDKGNYEEIVQESNREYIAFIPSENINTLVFSESSKSDDATILIYVKEGKDDKRESTSSKSSSNNSTISRGQQNALNRAKDYLEYQAFSYSGLIEQLEFEGFTNSEATFAVDNCGANWNEQAVLRAEQYLEYSSFSRSGLKEQLEFEGFTSSQAEYAVNQVY